MVKSKFETWRKRPRNTTPELALKLHQAGMTLQQIADAWGISKNRVWQLIQKAKKNT